MYPVSPTRRNDSSTPTVPWAPESAWPPLVARRRLPVFITRHGRTRWNLERRFLGRSNVALDETGRRQAKALAARLVATPFVTIVTSPLSRALETARIVAEASPNHPPVRLDERLAELDQGELEGQPADVLPTRYPGFLAAWRADPVHTRVPGGETLAECQARAWAALSELQGPGPVLIVTHQMVISALICRVLGLPLSRHREIHQGNTALNLISRGTDGWRAHHLDDTAHLARLEPITGED